MVKPLYISLICFISFIPTYAQYCGGSINFTLYDTSGSCIGFQNTRSNEQAIALTDSTSKYLIKANSLRDDIKYNQNLLSKHVVHSYITLNMSCEVDFQLLIVHQATEKKDSMLIKFTNVWDAHFGLRVDFVPGKYEILVCDTTKIPVSKDHNLLGFVLKPLEEQYAERLHHGFDITPKRWIKRN